MRLWHAIAALTSALATASSVAAGGGLPSYTTPDGTTSAATEGTKLTARDVTGRLFKATPGSRPDLSELNLTRLDLAELDFKSAKLDGADLYGAELSRAKLAGCSLVGVRLDRATITSADFSGADLTDARILRPTIFTTLEVATSEAPRFTGAKLVRIRSDGWLDRADFARADLTGAVFGGGGPREETLFSSASLVSANFENAILKDAKFPGASLKYARFMGADLTGANLIGTNLTRADFTGANLAGADFTGANLDEADLRGARGLDQAIGLKSAQNLGSARFTTTAP
ncbi:pentapeptide repeat-containing protein [Hyphomicrobium sp.]|uniref:pentapeptide repeat-containing protein n=1 Tax=Hyphomicrobium sp. TaxID=82 RepID=UPI0025BFD884|nr:pentapeptide repeat-containing protein [Hyphomicrobium sp.]MCC7252534.1 pentapeptide repeat-containing protein [Hyphomicrobium sp.]